MNQQTFGKFQENFESGREFLNLSFSPSSLSIQQRWRNNGLSADFVADYMTTFFFVTVTAIANDKDRQNSNMRLVISLTNSWKMR